MLDRRCIRPLSKEHAFAGHPHVDTIPFKNSADVNAIIRTSQILQRRGLPPLEAFVWTTMAVINSFPSTRRVDIQSVTGKFESMNVHHDEIDTD